MNVTLYGEQTSAMPLIGQLTGNEPWHLGVAGDLATNANMVRDFVLENLAQVDYNNYATFGVLQTDVNAGTVPPFVFASIPLAMPLLGSTYLDLGINMDQDTGVNILDTTRGQITHLTDGNNHVAIANTSLLTYTMADMVTGGDPAPIYSPEYVRGTFVSVGTGIVKTTNPIVPGVGDGRKVDTCYFQMTDVFDGGSLWYIQVDIVPNMDLNAPANTFKAVFSLVYNPAAMLLP